MSRPPADTPDSVFSWSGRVLTWEDLRSRLAGVRELAIGTQTIVSPMVLDELRDRKITLRRGAPTTNGPQATPKSTGPGVAVEQADGIVSGVVSALQKEGLSFQTWAPKGSNLAGWAWSLGLLVKETNQTGIALVSDPALVACVAAKVAGVRPAQVLSALQVTRAMKGFGANLLAIEMPGRTFFELKQILRAAAATIPGSAAELERVFKEIDGHAHR